MTCMIEQSDRVEVCERPGMCTTLCYDVFSPFRAWFEVCVKAKSPDGKHTKQLGNAEHIPVIEFDYAFARDTPRDPRRKTSMMVATDSIHGSIFAVVARRKGGQDDYVMQSFQNYIDRLGLIRAEVEV